ncbi:hypothetical protein MRX96_037088 [Rhipicephalus microplus]
MRNTEVGVSNVPAFIVKLWKLVEDEKYNNLISWSSTGQSFIIHNQTQFAKELLPLYFKHNNMASLIRQLNMYGFHKVANINQGLRSDREEIEFFHSSFIRGQGCLLEYIKRKVPSSQAGAVVPDDARAQDVLKELLSDAGSMHGRQEQMDQLLAQMKKENGALWQEVSRLRQKHLKQQQIVGKLIHFLITMVQANRNITVKRKIPLMLHGSAGTGSKIPRLAKNAFVADYHVSSPAGSQVSDGPVIRDDEGSYVLPCSIEEVVVDSSDNGPREPMGPSSKSLIVPNEKALQVVASASTTDKQVMSVNSINEENSTMLGHKQASSGASDLLSNGTMLEDISMLEGDVEPPATASPLDLADLAKEESSKHEKEKAVAARSPEMQVALHDKAAGATKVFSEHIESIDSDLDWLQDQLLSGGLNLDTSTLMGLFSPEDLLTSCLADLATESSSISNAIANEVVQYTPSHLDLCTDDDTSFRPVSELLLSNNELPSSSSIAANGESAHKPGSLVASEKSLSLQPASPLSLQPDNTKLTQTVPRLSGKKRSMLGKKRRGNSKK